MRNLKRVLSLALALVMVLGMMVITTSAADFTDADEITYKEAVEVMAEIGILKGMGDGTFAPKGTLTRAQAAKIIAFVCLGAEADDYLTGSAAPFQDVEGHWAAKYVAYCKNAHIVDGNGDGTFNPNGKLTTVQFGKMLLGALGIEGTYTEGGWEANVKKALENADLDVITIDATEITREEACEMALAAMKHSVSSGKYWVVTNDDAESKLEEYADLITATLYCNLLNNDADPAPYKVIPAPKTDALLTKYYDVTWNDETGVDSYGRKATVYSYTDEQDETKDWTLTYVTEKAVKTYDAETKADAIAKDLKGYKVGGNNVEGTTEATWNLSGTKYVIVDGTEMTIKAAAALTENCTLSEALAALTDDNAVVEIYANNTKVITKIVIVETNYAVVTDAVEADAEKEIDASFKVDGKDVKKVEGFKNGDVVTYVEDSTGVTKVTKLEGFAGTMTKYTSKGVYTIGDAAYELSDSALVEASAIQNKQGKEMFYFLDKNGDIVNMTVVPGEEEEVVVINDYAVITGAKVVRTAETDVWTGRTVYSYAMKIQAVLSDGTVGTYDLPIVENDDEVMVYMIGETEKSVEDLGWDDESVEKVQSIAVSLPNTYTYTLDGTEITLAGKLAAFAGTETEDAVVVRKNDAKITKASTTIAVDGVAKTVIANENTVFVLGVKNDEGDIDSYVVKTGIAALEATEIAKGAARVVIDVTVGKNADGEVDTDKNVNVAAVVFAETTEFKATAATGTDNAIYVDGEYVVTKATVNGEVKYTYTYTAVKEDGTTIEVTGAKDLPAGIYTYKTDMTIVTDGAATTKYTVGVISGTTVQMNSTYVTVNDKTTVVSVAEGATLATGAECYMTDGLIFVVKAAE